MWENRERIALLPWMQGDKAGATTSRGTITAVDVCQEALAAIDAWAVRDLRWFSPDIAESCKEEIVVHCRDAGRGPLATENQIQIILSNMQRKIACELSRLYSHFEVA